MSLSGDLLERLQVLQNPFGANEGNRASGTAGYDASVEYVVQRLQAAGYEPLVQEFDFEFFAVLGQLFAIDGVEQPPFDFSTQTGVFDVMTYSGSGTVVDAPVLPTSDVVVPIGNNPANTSTSGCEPDDFAPAPSEDTVALVQRGTCSFFQKVLNAQNAGYDAVIVFNEGQPGRDGVVLGTLGADAVGTITIPAIGVSYGTGVDLLNDPDVVVTIENSSPGCTARTRSESGIVTLLF